MAPKKNTTTTFINENATEKVSYAQAPPAVPRKRKTRSITRKTAQEDLITVVEPTPEVPTPVATEKSRNRSITKNEAAQITFVAMEQPTTVKGKAKRRRTAKGTEVEQVTLDDITKKTDQSISSTTGKPREIKIVRNTDDVSETPVAIERQIDQSISNIITTERIIDAEQSSPAIVIKKSTYQPFIKPTALNATTGRSKGKKTARIIEVEHKPPDAIEQPVDLPIPASGKNKGKKAAVRSTISIFTDQPTPIKAAAKKSKSKKPANEQTGKVLKSLRSRKPAHNVNQATTVEEQPITISCTNQEIYAGEKEKEIVADHTITDAFTQENTDITNPAVASTSKLKIYTRGMHIADQNITADTLENNAIINSVQAVASSSKLRIDAREKNVADQTITAETQKNTFITNTAKVTSTPRLTRKISQPIRARSARLAVKALKEREERERLAREELMKQTEQTTEEAHTVKRNAEEEIATLVTEALDEVPVHKRTRREPERNISPAQEDDIEQANIKRSRRRTKFEREVPTTNQQIAGNELSNARHNMRCVPPLVADPTPRNITPYHWYLAQSSWQNNS
ncbi:2892_t:CDS:2 [Funneliformis mosseae]|uniref:2892_t:CDS:1 n=1 Tax=Funneliformis mosseae TaxID=27381 RepID=A0A9N9AP99_FUNMO|nr:2892_t:CDS:2 [Funneliformis mosseae]